MPTTLFYGRVQDDFIQQTINSLEMVQPRSYRSVRPRGLVYTIPVRNQLQFETMNDEISKAILAGKKNIQVKIGPGIYQFHQEHICRRTESADVSISFIGHDTIITSDKNFVTTGGKGSGWLELCYADSLIQVIDEKEKLCFIPYANNMNEGMKKNLEQVQITQWFRAKTYQIVLVDETGIYFIAPDLMWENGYGHKGYNVNFDYLYLGKKPRFRFFTTSQNPDCVASRFITLENCSYRSLTINGIDFRSTNKGSVLLSMTNVSAEQISIRNCSFNNIRGSGVGYFSRTGNVVFDNNKVSETGGDELFFSNDCSNIRITNNMFSNCGQNLGNTFCVRCYEAEYYIANNTFCNFGYGAIGVGMWHGFTKNYPSRGIIENNELYFSIEYFKDAWKYMLMDSGAIYTWSQNDEVIIRYNYIHDYTGAGDNRGVFCDDGANNVKIYRNVIVNTPNSYSIDSRVVDDQHPETRNNENNFIAYNVVDNGIRFQGQKNENRHVVKGPNYLIHVDDGMAVIQNKYDDLDIMETDIKVKSYKLNGSRLRVIKE